MYIYFLLCIHILVCLLSLFVKFLFIYLFIFLFIYFQQNKELPPIQQQPLVPLPYLIPNDKTATRSETTLAGRKIACFIVGGEKRLCLPQVVEKFLLYNIPSIEINEAGVGGMILKKVFLNSHQGFNGI